MDFLELEAYLVGEFLHPGGEALTHLLLQKLAMPGRLALDLGCGTGATAALMARVGGMHVVGLDRSPEMLHAAHARVRNEQIGETICLVRGNADDPLPFADHSFHVVYAESVLALIDPERGIAECARVLQAGGQLALIERIWKPGLSQAIVDQVNAASQHAFGIPAATREALDRDDWLQLLSNAGLDAPETVRVDALISGRQPGLALRRRAGRLRRYLRRPSTLWHSVNLKRDIRRHRALWRYLESYLFMAQMPEP